MNLWTDTGESDGPGFPGPADTLTPAEARDLLADRVGQLEARLAQRDREPEMDPRLAG